MSQRLDSPEDEEYDEYDLASARSLISTANDLVLEYGRRYPNYAYGSQPFPKGDEMAIRNEIALHSLLLHLYDNKPFLSNIEFPQNVLDVRSGTQGTWAKNMADFHPEAQVTGLEDFPIRSEGQENLQFIVQNYNDQWILDEVTQVHGKFDFIYARGLFAGSRDFPTFYEQCFENLEKGGYFEQTEVMTDVECDDENVDRNKSMVAQLVLLIPILSKVVKTDYNIGSKLKEYLAHAGFVEIVEHRHRLPWSAWPDPVTDPKEHEAGRLMQQFYETGLQGWMLKPLIDHFGMTPEQVDEWCEGAFAELRSNRHKWYSYNTTITARKPPV